MWIDLECGFRECLRFKLCLCVCMDYVCESIVVFLNWIV